MPGSGKRVDEEPGQLGVVVEHLLEVGHVPAAIGAVAMETAPNLVVNAAIGDRHQRMIEHLGRGLGGRIFGIVLLGTSWLVISAF